MIAATTLRRLGQIDDVLARFVAKPLPDKTGRGPAILRAGACEALFMTTPDHALVSAAVALAGEERETQRFKGLLNAVLRKVAGEGRAIREQQDAARFNTPDWLWARWCESYGEATARSIAERHLTPPPLDLTARSDPAAVAASLGGRVLPTGSVRLADAGRVDALTGFAEGTWWVQGAAAAVPARLVNAQPGMRVLDLCAAPGGKTLQLAAAGADVTAVDPSAERFARVEENLARTGLAARLVRADGTTFRAEAAFDAVLVDAPCTATGTIQRHPDVAHLKQPDDLDVLTRLQDQLLARAADLTRPGGVLVFSTCSLEPEEGEARIRQFLAARTDYNLDPIDVSDLVGPSAKERAADDRAACTVLLGEPGTVRALPCHWPALGGIDGFFAARLRRRTG